MDDAPRRNRRRRLVPLGIVGALVVASLLTGGAATLALSGDPAAPAARAAAAATADHPPDTTHSPDPAPPPGSTGAAVPPSTTIDGGAAAHTHDSLGAYADRLGAATAEEQAAARELLDDVRQTLGAYGDVGAALAAGYRPPAAPRGATVHYRNPALIRDDRVLDRTRPEGLVYFVREGADPVLLGAFFVAPAGIDAPMPAGELVVWHSHDPESAAFNATPDAPCTETRRMLHVWSIGEASLTRRTGEVVDVRVSDPFGAPFGASIGRAR